MTHEGNLQTTQEPVRSQQRVKGWSARTWLVIAVAALVIGQLLAANGMPAMGLLLKIMVAPAAGVGLLWRLLANR